MARSLGVALTSVAVCAAYYLGAKVGFTMVFPSVPTSIFWLPNSTMFAVLLLARPSRWWIYLLAALPAHIAVQAQHSVRPVTMALLFLTNVGDAALGALLVRAFAGPRPRLDSFRNVVVFLTAAMAAPFVVSFFDAGIMFVTRHNSAYWLIWSTRFRSNVLTNFIWVPPVVIALGARKTWLAACPRPRRIVEAGLLALALFLVGNIVFGTPHVGLGVITALPYAPVPLFLWAVFRFGTGGVSGALLGFAGLVIWNAVHGRGPFTMLAPAAGVLTVQVFLTLLSAPMLLLAALLQDRRRVEGALRDSEAQYRSIFEATSDGLLITDAGHAIVAANPALCQLTGFDMGRLRDLQPRDVFHLDDLQPLDAYLSRAIHGGAFTAQAMCVRENGELSRFEIDGRRFGYAGQPHVLSVVRDVTQREREVALLEQRVAERTRVLTTLLEISSTVASTLELEPLLQVVLEQLRIIVRYSGATIFIEEKQDLVVLDHRHPTLTSRLAAAEPVRLRASDVASWPMLRRGSPLIIDDLHGDSLAARAFRAATPRAVTDLFGRARSVLVVPLKAREQSLGVLWIDNDEPNQYTLGDAQLAWALANQAAVAIENAQLYSKARELAAFDERQRIARELHDSVTQTLHAVAMLGDLLPRAWQRDPTEGGRILGNLSTMTRSALAEMRALLLELRPGALLQTGLGELLQQLADALRSRIDVPILIEVEDAASALPSDIHVTFYRLAQEALSNIVKHAAASKVHVKLRCSDESATMCIRDDGAGFEPPWVRPGHMGLRIMYERAAAVGAGLFIESAPGRGTEITVRWPLPQTAN